MSYRIPTTAIVVVLFIAVWRGSAFGAPGNVGITPKGKLPSWKIVRPELDDAPTTWDKVVGLAETGHTSDALVLFNAVIAPKLDDPVERLERLVFMWGSAGETTKCLECILEVNRIKKERHRGQKDQYGFDMSNFDFQLDAEIGNLYYAHRLHEKALRLFEKMIQRQLFMMDHLSSSPLLTEDQRRRFLAGQYTLLGGYYQSLALVQEALKQYDRALVSCRKMMECAEAFNPPLGDDISSETVARVRRVTREGSVRLMNRIRRKIEATTGTNPPLP